MNTLHTAIFESLLSKVSNPLRARILRTDKSPRRRTLRVSSPKSNVLNKCRQQQLAGLGDGLQKGFFPEYRLEGKVNPARMPGIAKMIKQVCNTQWPELYHNLEAYSNHASTSWCACMCLGVCAHAYVLGNDYLFFKMRDFECRKLVALLMCCV
jgi:hypothetical protein